MDGLPQLPPDGPLRTFVITATCAVIALLVGFIVQARQGERRVILWAALPLLLLVVATPLGRVSRLAHTVTSFAAIAVALYNAYRWRGLPRWLEAAGATALLAASLLAPRVFGR
jgi:hypothetical protein